MRDKVMNLTEPQREALRLVARGMSSKEIAQQLGLSHHAIDRRIDRAVAALGARDRRDAARRLAITEGATYDPLIYQPTPLVGDGAIEETRPADTATAVSGFPWPFHMPGRPDGLPLGWRLFWALVGIPVIVMVALGMLLSAIAALDTLRL